MQLFVPNLAVFRKKLRQKSTFLSKDPRRSVAALFCTPTLPHACTTVYPTAPPLMRFSFEIQIRVYFYDVLTLFFYTDYIRYWLGSIHTYSSEEAPVILALTHAEANGADRKEVHMWKTLLQNVVYSSNFVNKVKLKVFFSVLKDL